MILLGFGCHALIKLTFHFQFVFNMVFFSGKGSWNKMNEKKQTLKMSASGIFSLLPSSIQLSIESRIFFGSISLFAIVNRSFFLLFILRQCCIHIDMDGDYFKIFARMISNSDMELTINTAVLSRSQALH